LKELGWHSFKRENTRDVVFGFRIPDMGKKEQTWSVVTPPMCRRELGGN
jgi:hypothetical protein